MRMKTPPTCIRDSNAGSSWPYWRLYRQSDGAQPFPWRGKIAAATASPSDRLGKLLPLRKLGSSGPVLTNLGVGGDHVGSASEKDAQAIIEKALEEGVRFFDNAPFTAVEKQRNAMENSSLPSTGTFPSS